MDAIDGFFTLVNLGIGVFGTITVIRAKKPENVTRWGLIAVLALLSAYRSIEDRDTPSWAEHGVVCKAAEAHS